MKCGDTSNPEASTTDNGNVLTVVEGEWNKASVPTELPAVSSTDNGDVLTVVEGEWAKAAPSGGVGELIVTIEHVNEGNAGLGYYACDKTAQEILDAADDGKIVYFRYSENGTWEKQNYSPLICAFYSNDHMMDEVSYSFRISLIGIDRSEMQEFSTASGDAYPVYYPSGGSSVDYLNVYDDGGDGESPETFTCYENAENMYAAYRKCGVRINDHVVVDCDTSNGYDFTVLIISSGTITSLTYHADDGAENPYYTASN